MISQLAPALCWYLGGLLFDGCLLMQIFNLLFSIFFKNTKNLFIHIALIPLGDLLEISQHFKMSPPFASSEGVSVSGDRYQSDDA